MQNKYYVIDVGRKMNYMDAFKEIQQQFNDVIRYSQSGISNPKTDRLFDRWAEAKSDIYTAFGEKLIYEYPEKVTFELSEKAKNDRISNFITSMWDLGFDELGRFLDRQRKGFFKNSVVEEYIVTTDKTTTITKNTKLVKAFKYFIKNESVLNELQSKASQLIQENKIEGTLCFSIHPLDYLSVSENNYNWRSCHALDGEYRAGNLSYMLDSSTIVCYLKGDGDTKLPHFPESVPWNNKKWRVLLYLSNDWRMVFAGKQYPFSTETGMNMVLEFLNKKFRKHPADNWYSIPAADAFWTKWSDYSVSKITNDDIGVSFDLDDEYIPMTDKLVSLYDLVVDKDGSKHFNDVLKSSCYKPMYSYLAYENNWNHNNCIYAASSRTNFEIGGMTYCLRCGHNEIIDSSESMMCYDCEYQYGTSENDIFCFCSECGARLLTDNSYYVNDETYCEECYDKYAARCARCGDTYRLEDMIYDDESEVYYCKWCNEE